MRILFRVDAGIGIGTGHVSRCLALARCLRLRGADCRFVQRPHAGSSPGLIRDAGFEVTEISPPAAEVAADMDYELWLGAPVENDAAETREIVERVGASWMVVDHYGAEAAWEARATPPETKLLVIDDLANRRHRCDVLLDQNFFQRPLDRYAEHIAEGTRTLFGPMHALLRPDYARARSPRPPVGQMFARAFVFYGGSDSSGETERAVRVLADVDGRKIPADVVVGAAYRERGWLKAAADDHGAMALYGPQPHLADLIAGAQLALGAGGVTAWERCTLGVPAVVTTIVDNQVAPTQALAEIGACAFAGESRDMTDAKLRACTASLLANPEARDRMALNAWLMTDGHGAERTAEVMLPTPSEAVRLRPADHGDTYLYYVWANDPAVRSNAYNPDPIAWADHARWFDGKLAGEGTVLLVLETPDGLPLGQLRVDSRDGVGEIDYSISESFRGRGLGVTILKLAVEYLARHAPFAELVGYVLPDNAASQRAFARAGFHDRGAVSDGSRAFAITVTP